MNKKQIDGIKKLIPTSYNEQTKDKIVLLLIDLANIYRRIKESK